MGLLSFFKRTKNKTAIMKKMINVLDITYYDPVNGFNKNIPSKEKIEEVYNEFFNFIESDEILGTILKEYNVTYEEFKIYLDLMKQNGWGWNNGRYIPVDVFSFGKEMQYFLKSIKNNEDINVIYSNLIRKNY